MVKMIRQTSIRAVHREQIVIRPSAASIETFCPKCGAMQQTLSASQAAQLLQVSEREIFGMVENDDFHIFETNDGRLYICALSISFQNQDASVAYDPMGNSEQ